MTAHTLLSHRPRITRFGLSGLTLASMLVMGGCAQIAGRTPTSLGDTTPMQSLTAQPTLRADMAAAINPTAKAATDAPATGTAPTARPADAATEPRFDLIVNGAAARDVFLALGADTRYNILTHPDLSGTISVTLRRVTLREALEAIRDVYGYDFKLEGRRITVFPPTMQTRVFVVNYLHSQRSGRSDVRVSSGSAPANNGTANGGAGSASGTGSSQPDSSQITTTSRNDLWGELGEALRGMVGSANGRSVIVSPQSGMIAVRAMPDELRQVEAMLHTARLAIERQVMLDVKIVSVELREGFQSGIDWSILRSRGAVGSVGGSGSNPLLTNANGLPTLPSTALSLLNDSLPMPAPGSGLFGLSLAANGFQAVLGFLETHGDVQTLSSPRLATLNNQKAVLKVGTDDYFVTNVSGGTVSTGSQTTAGTTTMPTLSLTPFFSGIALDVTPQIDEGNMITLHVHPSVSVVNERKKQVDLGTLGSYKLPLASSSINETDTVVRIPDGQIVAIGGLMQMESSRSASGLPGSNDNALTASLLGNRNNGGSKKELVVLIKPSIIRSAEDWQAHTRQAWDTLEADTAPVRVIRLDGPAGAKPTAAATQAKAAAVAPAAAVASNPVPHAAATEATGATATPVSAANARPTAPGQVWRTWAGTPHIPAPTPAPPAAPPASKAPSASRPVLQVNNPGQGRPATPAVDRGVSALFERAQPL